MHGESVGSALHLKDSPFWTLTPAYCEDIHIHDLRVTAPMDRIGNTDGVNIDSCRRVVVENVWISNSDDGVCMKSGLDGKSRDDCWHLGCILPKSASNNRASRTGRWKRWRRTTPSTTSTTTAT